MAFIKKMIGGIGKALGKVTSFVKKVWNNPLFKLALNVGMMFIPGGAIVKGLGMLGKLGSLGQTLTSFAGFAQKFMGPLQSMMQSGPLKMLSGFLGQAGNSSNLLSMATDLFSARQSQQTQNQPPGLGDAYQMGLANIQQMFAFSQANQLRSFFG